MFPAAYLSDFGPGGEILFYSILVLALAIGVLYSCWRNKNEKSKWKKVLNESRAKRKSKHT